MNETALTLVKSQVTTQALQQYEYDPSVIDQAVMLGDMKKMDAGTRLAFYRAVCLSAGLNPLTQPFTALERQDKTVWLYANSTCAQQLAKLHRVSFTDLKRTHETILGDPIYRVDLTAVTPDGRSIPAQGVVSLTKKKRMQSGKWPSGDPKFVDALDEDGEPIYIPLRGEALANAMMKCDTKAQRRAVLALVGLGWMATDYEGRTVLLDTQTGELLEEAPTKEVRLLETPHEAGKGLQEHISDLFDTGTPDPRSSEVGRQIDALMAAAGLSVADMGLAWGKWRQKYPDLTPGVLGMLRDKLQAARQASPEAQAPEGDALDAPSLWEQEEASAAATDDIPF